MSKAIYL